MRTYREVRVVQADRNHQGLQSLRCCQEIRLDPGSQRLQYRRLGLEIHCHQQCQSLHAARPVPEALQYQPIERLCVYSLPLNRLEP